MLAQEEARSLGHNHIGTEHLLLGLLREEPGLAVQVLERLDVSPEAMRNEIERVVGGGSGTSADHIPFTPRAKKVLELSLREALQLGHNYIGTEHLLLGLIREGDGVAAQVLAKHGVDLERTRQEILHLLASPATRAEAGLSVDLDQAMRRLRALEETASSLRADFERIRADIDERFGSKGPERPEETNENDEPEAPG